MNRRSAWIVAYTINHGNNHLEERWDIYATRKEAAEAYGFLLLADNVHNAAYGQMKDATEPHWMCGDL